MRIYFTACTPAILKLNGLYAGGVDKFERHVELDLNDNILAEIVPGENLQPVNFFIDEKLLSSPPDFLDVYLFDNDALLHVKKFGCGNGTLKVIFQTRFQGNLITVFSQGETYLSVEGQGYDLTPVGGRFKSVHAAEKVVNGYPVLALWGGDALILISHTGERIFANEVTFAEFGLNLKVGLRFETVTCAEAHCEYSYDGKSLTLVSSKTVEKHKPEEKVLHFAFFESVLTFGDYKKYLSQELLPAADDVREFLGQFAGVTVPTEKFYLLHPDVRAAGLVYPQKENLFRIKYFAVDLKDGKVENIYPVEQ